MSGGGVAGKSMGPSSSRGSHLLGSVSWPFLNHPGDGRGQRYAEGSPILTHQLFPRSPVARSSPSSSNKPLLHTHALLTLHRYPHVLHHRGNGHQKETRGTFLSSTLTCNGPHPVTSMKATSICAQSAKIQGKKRESDAESNSFYREISIRIVALDRMYPLNPIKSKD